MSFSKTWGSAALTIGQDDEVTWNYSTALRVISDSGTTVRLTDIVAPLDKRTTVKYSLSKIANVYSTLGGDTVPIAERSSNISGQTLFCELTTILTKPNPVVANGIIQVPIQSRVELRLPNDGDLTDADIGDVLAANIALLKGETGEPKMVSELLRGALVPAGL